MQSPVVFYTYNITRASQHLQDLGWLRAITNLPILIKGVLTREDGKISILCNFVTLNYIIVMTLIWHSYVQKRKTFTTFKLERVVIEKLLLDYLWTTFI